MMSKRIADKEANVRNKKKKVTRFWLGLSNVAHDDVCNHSSCQGLVRGILDTMQNFDAQNNRIIVSLDGDRESHKFIDWINDSSLNKILSKTLQIEVRGMDSDAKILRQKLKILNRRDGIKVA